MQRRITWVDNMFLLMPFVIMFSLYGSSSMTYETQSLLPMLENLLSGEPFKELLSKIQFTYGGSLVSIEQSGYFSFIEFFIRKGAHFFSYFLLGFFWDLGLQKRVNDKWLVVLLSILLCIGYASFDELRQSFNPGRTGMMADVILDTAGAVTGTLVAQLLVYKRIIR